MTLVTVLNADAKQARQGDIQVAEVRLKRGAKPELGKRLLAPQLYEYACSAYHINNGESDKRYNHRFVTASSYHLFTNCLTSLPLPFIKESCVTETGPSPEVSSCFS